MIFHLVAFFSLSFLGWSFEYGFAYLYILFIGLLLEPTRDLG